jgi:hypothetical protein
VRGVCAVLLMPGCKTLYSPSERRCCECWLISSKISPTTQRLTLANPRQIENKQWQSTDCSRGVALFTLSKCHCKSRKITPVASLCSYRCSYRVQEAEFFRSTIEIFFVDQRFDDVSITTRQFLGCCIAGRHEIPKAGGRHTGLLQNRSCASRNLCSLLLHFFGGVKHSPPRLESKKTQYV